MRIFSIIIICIFIANNVHAFTIKSGQVWSSDGNIYDFASPDEKKKLIEKHKSGGDQVGVMNNNLFVIVGDNIINIPLSKIRGASDSDMDLILEEAFEKFEKDKIKNRPEVDSLLDNEIVLDTKDIIKNTREETKELSVSEIVNDYKEKAKDGPVSFAWGGSNLAITTEDMDKDWAKEAIKDAAKEQAKMQEIMGAIQEFHSNSGSFNGQGVTASVFVSDDKKAASVSE